MLNINDLEKRWVEYKIRSIAPYIIGFLTLVFVTVATYFFLFSKEDTLDSSEKKEIQKPVTVEKKQKIPKASLPKEKVVKEELPPVKEITVPIKKKEKISPLIIKELPKETIKQQTENKIIIRPSMQFLQNFQTTPSYKEPVKKIKKKKIAPIALPTEEYVEAIKTEKKSAPEPVKEQIQEEKNIKKITIKRRESENDIKEVLSRFQQNNNPALSLFAAKKYYELGNYKQAYNYALITNKINNDIEESWLIFARSLIKLGKKDQAVKTLQKYISYSHSSNAQILLDEIQRGKFQ